jgi:hypothetical protein
MNKLCPLRKSTNKAIFYDCFKSSCAWYIEHKQQCAISAIGELEIMPENDVVYYDNNDYGEY